MAASMFHQSKKAFIEATNRFVPFLYAKHQHYLQRKGLNQIESTFSHYNLAIKHDSIQLLLYAILICYIIASFILFYERYCYNYQGHKTQQRDSTNWKEEFVTTFLQLRRFTILRAGISMQKRTLLPREQVQEQRLEKKFIWLN